MLQSIKTTIVTVCGTQSTAIVESSLHPLILNVMTHVVPPPPISRFPPPPQYCANWETACKSAHLLFGPCQGHHCRRLNCVETMLNAIVTSASTNLQKSFEQQYLKGQHAIMAMYTKWSKKQPTMSLQAKSCLSVTPGVFWTFKLYDW